MKNKNKKLLLVFMSTWLLISSVSFAQDITSSISPALNQTTQAASIQNINPYDGLWNFIKNKDSLTVDEQNEIKAIMEYCKQAIWKIVSGSKNLTQSEINSQIKDVNTAFFKSIKKYIDPAKSDDFDKWAENAIAQYPQGPHPTTQINSTASYSTVIESTRPVITASEARIIPNTWEIELSGKISAPYKVSLSWSVFTPTSWIELQGYKLIVTYNDWTNKIISITSNKTSIDNWDAKQNMVNTYVIFAVTDDWAKHESNHITIAMGPNGSYDFSEQDKSNDNKSEKSQSNIQENISQTWANINEMPPQKINRPSKNKSSVLWNIRDKYISLLDKIPDDQKEAKFQAIVWRIDNLIQNAKNDSLKRKLQELKDITQEKLNALSNNSNDSSLINQIMDDWSGSSN